MTVIIMRHTRHDLSNSLPGSFLHGGTPRLWHDEWKEHYGEHYGALQDPQSRKSRFLLLTGNQYLSSPR